MHRYLQILFIIESNPSRSKCCISIKKINYITHKTQFDNKPGITIIVRFAWFFNSIKQVSKKVNSVFTKTLSIVFLKVVSNNYVKTHFRKKKFIKPLLR